MFLLIEFVKAASRKARYSLMPGNIAAAALGRAHEKRRRPSRDAGAWCSRM
jgi:hypothetical protein